MVSLHCASKTPSRRETDMHDLRVSVPLWLSVDAAEGRGMPHLYARHAAEPYKLLLLQVLRGRIVARVDGVFQEVVLVVGPELAHIRIGLDDGVDIFPVLLLDFADVNVSDDVPKLVAS